MTRHLFARTVAAALLAAVAGTALTAPAASAASAAAAPTSAVPAGSAVSTASAATAATRTAALTGSARLAYPVATDVVRVRVDAHATYGASPFPDRAWGTFRISHRYTAADGTPVQLWGDFRVDCLTVGGRVATVTGAVVRVPPGSPWHVGDRSGASFAVPRHGTARVGLAGIPDPPLSRCMAPAPDAAVVNGGYDLAVRGAGTGTRD